MRITVGSVIRFDDVDNLRELSLSTDLSPTGLDARLRSELLGRVTDGYAWLNADALRDCAGASSADPDWAAGYAAMVDYARSKGWWDDPTNSIRTHITSAS